MRGGDGRGGPRPVQRGGDQPLWRQVYDDLVRRVGAGEFVAEFPGELAIVDQYGVSRHTVREALRRLRAEGVVSSGRGRTSRVTPPAEIEQPVGTSFSLFAAVEASGHSQRSIVRDLSVVSDGVVAVRLGREESTPLVYLERVRLSDDDPLALDRVWLPADVAEPLLAADFTRTALYAELSARCGITVDGGSEVIRAVVGTPAEQRLLAMPVGVAALSVERLGRSEGRAVEWRHTLVRGDRFAVSAEFSGSAGVQVGGPAGA